MVRRRHHGRQLPALPRHRTVGGGGSGAPGAPELGTPACPPPADAAGRCPLPPPRRRRASPRRGLRRALVAACPAPLPGAVPGTPDGPAGGAQRAHRPDQRGRPLGSARTSAHLGRGRGAPPVGGRRLQRRAEPAVRPVPARLRTARSDRSSRLAGAGALHRLCRGAAGRAPAAGDHRTGRDRPRSARSARCRRHPVVARVHLARHRALSAGGPCAPDGAGRSAPGCAG